MSHELERAQAQQQQQQPPQTLIGAGGQVASSVVSSLGGQPLMLVVVLLNAAFLGAGSWYLASLEGYRHDERLKSIAAFERCMGSLAASTPPTPTYGPGPRPAPPTP